MQTVLVGAAVFCAASRVLDHRHHLQDVLAGSLLGALLGGLTALTLNIEHSTPDKRQT